MTSQEALEKIKAIVGPKGWTDTPADQAPWLTDSRRQLHGRCALMVFPATTTEVSEILKICNAARLPVVPQGGNTGRCGGATPSEDGTAVLLNLARMNRVRDLDADDYSIVVEAGCILADIQSAAGDADRYFPLSLGAEGSCQIGGNLATNAGGINVLRYGNARDLVLGLEAVTPDGRVLSTLNRLRKNNTGYDLKQLFIGSEGTLGIITAAVLRLYPKPTEQVAALCALCSLDDCTALLSLARSQSGDSLSSFELIPGIALDCAAKHIDGVKRPFDTSPDWSVLLEFTGTGDAAHTADMMQSFLETAFGAGLITNGVVSQSEQQRADLWHLREAIVEAQRQEGASIKHDVAVPVSRVPAFLRRADAAVAQVCPDIRPYAFGHVGDGNIHYNLTQPADMEPAQFLAQSDALHDAVHDIVHDLGGSFSAEHGIGRIKRPEMARYKSDVELDLMKSIKAVLDPTGIMNPGKVLPD